jgi:adenylate cyclase
MAASVTCGEQASRVSPVLPVVSELTVACRSDPLDMWHALTDTERLNRALGMSKITVRPLSDATAARYLVSTHLGGLPVEYEERPYEWIYPRSFRIVRRMRSGPLLELDVAYTLTPRQGGGTVVALRLGLLPRYGVLGPFVRFMAGVTRRNFDDVIRQMDAAIVAGHGHAPPVRRSQVNGPHREAAQRAEATLRTAEPDRLPVVDRIVALVRDGDDFDVSRLRPFALADEWHQDRRDVLGVCLSAVRAGLLDLRWEIVCPSCRTATDVLPSLASLSDHGACQLCDLEFAIDLEDAVEATFAPALAIREVDVGPYCIGGPARTPHVLAQAVLPAGGEATLPCPIEEGRYRLFVRGGAAVAVEVRAGAPDLVRFTPAPTPITEALAVAPSGSIVVENPGSAERHAKLERVGWTDEAARARVVTAMPGFRRDFSTDILRPGVALKVARVGLFFSDLTGSTQLYTTAGDAAAFKLVHDHFDVVIALIESHRGTLVKTIGDAVMAVFSDDVDGLVASVAILHAFEEFRRGDDGRLGTHIKLGVFGGPCYVVTANGVLDYFGQTVNIAARLQGEAKGGELVVEESLADRAIALKMLPEAFVVQRYDAALKGVGTRLRAARIRLPPAAPGAGPPPDRPA